MSRAAGALLLMACVRFEYVQVGTYSLESTQWEQDVDELKGLAVPTTRCPRAEESIDVLETRGDTAEHVRVKGCGNFAFFVRCRWLVGQMPMKRWVPSGTDCPPPPEQ